ncbi:MAG: RIP metalloprotease RseP [Rhodobacteraceae bacterium PARR1]|nr:MAG: RIP metalloprotease RseP [Rhodobacteraceae bacterium PARR1]
MDIATFLPTFGNFAFTLVAFVVALSVIVFVHEYGHYIVGRWSGIRAEVFSLGFGPVLWSRVDKHGTRWQVAALPFGGYVKFLGDSNAASAKADAGVYADLTPEERRATMHGAPLWARAATVAAGPLFNFILSAVIFAGIFLTLGVATDRPTVGSLHATPFQGESLRPGDEITALNGQPTPDFAALSQAIDTLPAAASVRYGVLRDGREVTVDGPFPRPPLVLAVHPQSAAAEAGLQAGDVVTALNGTAIFAFGELEQAIRASEGKPQALTVWRAGESFDITLTPRRSDLPLPEGGFETRWLIGLSGGLVFSPETRMPGVIEAITMAASTMWNLVTTSLSALWHMVSGAISSCNLRGPIGIAETAGAAASAGVADFIWMIAALSTAVGLMNLFPVPVLDGGHLVFHLYEAVTRRPPTDRAMRGLMTLGLVLIASLMIFALTNDLFC